MAKSKKTANDELDIFAKMAQETGGDVVCEMEQDTGFIDTGNFAINYSCSGRFKTGGLQQGRIIELYGPSASAKSLLAMNCIAGVQKAGGVAILIDSENAFNPEFAVRASGIDPKKLVRYVTYSIEQSFTKINNFANWIRKQDKFKDVPVLVVYDSISVSPCERELRESQLPENYTDADFKRVVGGKAQPGERAKIIGNELRKVNTVLEKNNVALLLINQVRNAIGVMYGNPETTAAGGAALPFYCSQRIRAASQKKIEEKLAGGRKRYVGVNIQISNKKNRSTRPFIMVDGVNLMFDTGINPLSGLLAALIDADRIVAAGAGNFTIKPEFASSEDVKFKSSLERNDVPIDVLLAHPKLIDAESADEIREYLSHFKNVNVVLPGEQDNLEFSDTPDDEIEG